MTALRLTRDFLAWCAARDFTVSRNTTPPEWWALITMYEREREAELWPCR